MEEVSGKKALSDAALRVLLAVALALGLAPLPPTAGRAEAAQMAVQAYSMGEVTVATEGQLAALLTAGADATVLVKGDVEVTGPIMACGRAFTVRPAPGGGSLVLRGGIFVPSDGSITFEDITLTRATPEGYVGATASGATVALAGSARVEWADGLDAASVESGDVMAVCGSIVLRGGRVDGRSRYGVQPYSPLDGSTLSVEPEADVSAPVTVAGGGSFTITRQAGHPVVSATVAGKDVTAEVAAGSYTYTNTSSARRTVSVTVDVGGGFAGHDHSSALKEYDAGTEPGAVTATLYGDGCMAFEGAGRLRTLSSFMDQPWFAESSGRGAVLRRVEFDGSVAAADLSWYFTAASELEEVGSWPSGLESLGSASVSGDPGAFYACRSLSRVAALPSTVREMRGAFMACSSLGAAPALPAGVRRIDECFAYCRALGEAPLVPAGVTSMDRCFYSCDALASLPSGWAFPAGVDPDASMLACAGGADGGPLVTYCDEADYAALSAAIPWDDAARLLSARADLSGVEEAREAAAAIDLSLYTDESAEALRAAVAAAGGGAVSGQAEADALAAAIAAAIAALAPRPADYSGVDAAIAAAPSDLSGYTGATAAALASAVASVDRSKTAAEQAEVDAMAAAIRSAAAALEALADYSAVDWLLSAVPADLSGYTDASAAALQGAVSAVERGKAASEQAEVDAMAEALRAAFAGLDARADYSGVDSALASVPADLSGYTSATASAVRSAVEAVARGKGASEQGAVDGWVRAIREAVAALRAKAPQEVSTSAPSYAMTYGDAPVPLGASASGGGELSYEVVSGAGVVSVSGGGMVSALRAGAATVRVRAAASGDWLAGEAEVPVTVARAAQTIAVGLPAYSKTCGDAPFPLGASASGGGALSYEVVSGEGVVSVSPDGTVSVGRAGSAAVRVTAAETDRFGAASATVAVTVARAAQSVSAPSHSKVYGCAAFPLGASASGGGALSYEVVSGADVVSVSGSGMVSVEKAGTAVIRVGASETDRCSAASATATVTVSRAAQSVAASAPSYSKVYGCAPFSLGASASGGGALSYEVVSGADVVSVSGAGVVTVKRAGSAAVRVTAAETDRFGAASATATVTVAKAAQSVATSAATYSKVYGCAAFPLGARASGGGKLSYAVVSGAAVVSVSPAGKVAAKRVGTAKVRVTAAATAGYAAASRTVTVKIAKAAQSISAKSSVSKSFAGKGTGKSRALAKARSFQLKSLAKAKAKTAVKFKKLGGAAKVKVANSGKVTVAKGLKKGAYKVRVRLTAAASANYKAAKAKTVTLRVVVK